MTMYTYQIKSFKLWVTSGLLMSLLLLLHGCAINLPTQSPPITNDNKPYVPGGAITTSPPGTIGTVAPPSSINTNACNTYYTVGRGETLLGIATRCGLYYQDLARWNNLAPPYPLAPGQQLTLFGPPVPNTSSSATVSSGHPTSPSKITTNDGTYHTIVPGDTLSNLSKHYGFTINQLKTWNNLSSEVLVVGQLLRVSPLAGSNDNTATNYVPPNTTKTVVPVKKVVGQFENKSVGQYLVQDKDTIYSVAKLYGYAVADIAAWNNLQPPYNLTAGQILIVSPPTAITAATTATTSPTPVTTTPSAPVARDLPAAGEGYHTIVPNDTLFSLAKRYGTTVEQLKAWNGLSTNDLTVGQELRIAEDTTLTTTAAPPRTETPKAAAPKRVAAPKASSSPPRLYYKKYTVRQGETLYRVATKHGLSESELANLNGIGPPYTVYPGQQLIVTPKR